MQRIGRDLTLAAVIAVAVIGAPAARGEDKDREHAANRYEVTSLVSDIKGEASNVDPVLQNAWGVAFSPGASPFWVSDNATGCSTLYNGDGTIVSLQVKIPLPGNVTPSSACQHVDPKNPPKQAPAAPTGMVWNATTNPTTAFLVPGTTLPASFIWPPRMERFPLGRAASAISTRLCPRTTRSLPSTIRIPQMALSTKGSFSELM